MKKLSLRFLMAFATFTAFPVLAQAEQGFITVGVGVAPADTGSVHDLYSGVGMVLSLAGDVQITRSGSGETTGCTITIPRHPRAYSCHVGGATDFLGITMAAPVSVPYEEIHNMIFTQLREVGLTADQATLDYLYNEFRRIQSGATGDWVLGSHYSNGVRMFRNPADRRITYIAASVVMGEYTGFGNSIEPTLRHLDGLLSEAGVAVSPAEARIADDVHVGPSRFDAEMYSRYHNEDEGSVCDRYVGSCLEDGVLDLPAADAASE